MFNQKLKDRVSILEAELASIKRSHWMLWDRYSLLLNALGLQEVEHPAKTELVKKTDEAARGDV